jgi:hypothetical protein
MVEAMKKLSAILSGLVVACLIAWKLAEIYMLTHTSLHPDPATGHTVPVVFARVVSDSPSYLTTPQVWMMTGLLSVLLLCGVAYGIVSLIERRDRA